MPKPACIQLGYGRSRVEIPILHEDRAALAIDKPAGWMLVPFSWQSTQRNLHAALTSSIAAGDFWARSRNLRFLRNVHRLDAETTGILLLGKSPGAVRSLATLFESRCAEKTYLAVVRGIPHRPEWTCTAAIGRDPREIGRRRVDPKAGKPAETQFRHLQTVANQSLIEAHPLTGRTHQIRLHLLQAGLPIVGDALYGPPAAKAAASPARSTPMDFPMGLRAVGLRYPDPFLKRTVNIRAPADAFLQAYGFQPL